MVQLCASKHTSNAHGTETLDHWPVLHQLCQFQEYKSQTGGILDFAVSSPTTSLCDNDIMQNDCDWSLTRSQYFVELYTSTLSIRVSVGVYLSRYRYLKLGAFLFAGHTIDN